MRALRGGAVGASILGHAALLALLLLTRPTVEVGGEAPMEVSISGILGDGAGPPQDARPSMPPGEMRDAVPPTRMAAGDPPAEIKQSDEAAASLKPDEPSPLLRETEKPPEVLPARTPPVDAKPLPEAPITPLPASQSDRFSEASPSLPAPQTAAAESKPAETSTAQPPPDAAERPPAASPVPSPPAVTESAPAELQAPPPTTDLPAITSTAENAPTIAAQETPAPLVNKPGPARAPAKPPPKPAVPKPTVPKPKTSAAPPQEAAKRSTPKRIVPVKAAAEATAATTSRRRPQTVGSDEPEEPGRRQKRLRRRTRDAHRDAQDGRVTTRQEQRARGAASNPGARAAYLAGVASRLQRNTSFPEGAPSGMVVVRISIGRSGGVLSRHVVRSSGSSMLDAEALAMVDRSSPFPPFPDEVRDSQISLTAPISFRAR